MGFISEEGLEQLTPKNYKYNAGKYTWLDNKFNPLWYWLANQLPIYMAPNLVTFVGFLAILSSYSTMLYYDTTLKAEIPSWVFFKAGIEVIAYQLLDAMDGKQARRTNKSSALGQLFDHGCDSFALTFFLLQAAQATKLDTTLLFYAFIGCQLLMFLSNWIEYHTHVLNTQYANFGVTEGELIVAFINFITCFKGQSFWQISNQLLFSSQQLASLKSFDNFFINKWLDLTLCDNIALFFVFIAIFTFVFTFPATLKHAKCSKLEATLQFLPYIFIVTMEFLWFRSKIYYEFAGFLLLNFGILFSLIVVKLIVSSLAKMKFGFIHFQMFPLFLSTIYLYLYQDKISSQQLKHLFITISVANVLIAFIFLYGVINQITKKLNIKCLYLQEFFQNLFLADNNNKDGQQDNNKTK